MTSFSTIRDNFDSNSISSLWTVGGYTSPVFANQQLQMTIAASSTAITGMQSISNYDLTGAACSIQVVDAGPQSFSGWTVIPIFILLDFSNELYFQIENGFIQAFVDVAGIPTALQTATYVSATHQFLRIREQSGTIYWDTSADGMSWTNFTSLANPFSITALYMSFLAETGSTNTVPMTAKLDNFNVIQVVSSDNSSELESQNVTVLSNQSLTDTDSGVGSESAGGTRTIVVSRNPTDVGIAGLVDIVEPPFPEFTFGITSSGLLSVVVSDVDTIHGTDSVAYFAFGDIDSSVGADLGAHGTSIFDTDSSAVIDSVFNRSLSIIDFGTMTEGSTDTIVALSTVDSSTETDSGVQSFSVTSLDSSTGGDAQNVIIGTTFTSSDSGALSEHQVVAIGVSATDSSILAESVGNRSLTNIDSSIMSEGINRNIAASDMSRGSDFGFVAIISTDSCTATSQQSIATIILSSDTSQETESVQSPLSLSTTNDWIVGLDTTASRSIQSFDSSLMSDVVGNRTLQSKEAVAGTDAGIHGNFVFNPDSIRMSESFNYPVYSPSAIDTITQFDTSIQANSLLSTDSSTLATSQSFTIIVRDSATATETAQVGNTAISTTELILGTDNIASRTIIDLDRIVLADIAAPVVSIVGVESTYMTDIPVLYVPIMQTDRGQETDGIVSVTVNIPVTDIITETEFSVTRIRPTATDSIHATEVESIVKIPFDPDRNITVPESGHGTDQQMMSLVVVSTSLSIMAETQVPFRRSYALDNASLQTETSSLRVALASSETMLMTESSSIVRISSAMDSIHEIESQLGSTLDNESCVMADTASIVEYVSLNREVWAYGKVSVLQ